jgi:hypothetical protein
VVANRSHYTTRTRGARKARLISVAEHYGQQQQQKKKCVNSEKPRLTEEEEARAGGRAGRRVGSWRRHRASERALNLEGLGASGEY